MKYLLLSLMLMICQWSYPLEKQYKTGREQFPEPGQPKVALPGSDIPVLFLDFDGHIVKETLWNLFSDSLLNCTPAGLSAIEQELVTLGVAMYYSPFNVIVTREEKYYEAAPPNRRMRVVYTQSFSWYAPIGGVALIGSFEWGNDTPCFVFTPLLGYRLSDLVKAGTHEAGHTLGLRHQALYDEYCHKISNYNPGYDDYAPIMGNPYGKAAFWWVGPSSADCGEIQDDVAILKKTLK